MDVLYQSVMRVRWCIEGGGSVDWGFWQVKGGFQNVGRNEVLECLAGIKRTT